MKTRSNKVTIIPRVYTKSVVSLQFAKSKDSNNDIQNIINEAEHYLQKDLGCVIISMVMPDSLYKTKKNKVKIHQAHTFAITRNNKSLLVYDIAYNSFYKSNKAYVDNYKLVINTLKENRKIKFFPLTYGKKNNFKSTSSSYNKGDVCFAYVKELEEKNVLVPPQA